jgi:hypothetical protein
VSAGEEKKRKKGKKKGSAGRGKYLLNGMFRWWEAVEEQGEEP